MKHLRVRTGKGYAQPFNTVIGQPDAIVVSRALTPLRHLWRHAQSFCILEPGYDLIHTINSIPLLSSTPFIITFEDRLPRLFIGGRTGRSLTDFLRKRLLCRQCARLLAMSNYAVRKFRRQNSDFAFLHKLEEKLEVFYPSVPLRRFSPKRMGKTLSILAVGHDFMRKGIPAVARAHSVLRRKGIPLRTTVVSALNWMPNDYVGPPDAALVEEERRRLRDDGIVWRGAVDNVQVMELMQTHDYLVLPTFHDTFGYVTIEALACGTPVIAAQTCALTEIIDPSVCGAFLPIDNDEIGEWIWFYRPHDRAYIEAYRFQLESFSTALASCLENLWETRRDYERFSAGAIERVRDLFNREAARLRLHGIYKEVAGR